MFKRYYMLYIITMIGRLTKTQGASGMHHMQTLVRGLLSAVFQTQDGVPLPLCSVKRDAGNGMVLWPSHSHAVSARLALIYATTAGLKRGEGDMQPKERSVAIERLNEFSKSLLLQAFWLDTTDTNSWELIRDMLPSDDAIEFDGLRQLQRLWSGKYDLMRRPSINEIVDWYGIAFAQRSADGGVVNGGRGGLRRLWALERADRDMFRLYPCIEEPDFFALVSSREIAPEHDHLELLFNEDELPPDILSSVRLS